MIKIGINGFGRIGKTCFLQLLNDPTVKICAINAVELENKWFEQYLRHDSVHKYPNDFKVTIHENDYFSCCSQTNIKILRDKDTKKLGWKNYGCEYLIDCTGSYLTQDKCLEHNVNYVIMSAPSKDNSPTFVYGANHLNYSGEKIVSGASCTTNCITPVLKWFDDKLDIISCSFTTIHATTASQYTTDVLKKNSRTNRSILNSIIPHTTGASTAITEIIPSLKNKVQGSSLRVPVTNVSLVDMVVECNNKDYSLSEILKEIGELTGDLKDVLQVTKYTLVSCDFISTTTPSIIDSYASLDLGNGKYKLMVWYDNEWSYSAQLIKLLKHMYETNIKYIKPNLYEIEKIDFTNKNVLARFDFNVPMKDGIITDYFRIDSAIPTIRYILNQKINRLILCSHLGRPKNNQPEYSLINILRYIENKLKIQIVFLPYGLSSKTLSALNISDNKINRVYLLENVRLNKVETDFERLEPSQYKYIPEYIIFNQMFDIYINDAFGCSHRKHLSICGIEPNKIRTYGYLVRKELHNLDLIVKNTENKKILAIIGGGKIDDKIPMLTSLSLNVSTIFICGGNSNSILQGKFSEVLQTINNNYCKYHVANDGYGLTESNEMIYLDYKIDKDVSENFINMLDIGPNSLLELFELIMNHDIIFWNGTLGMVEKPLFSVGSDRLVKFLISNKHIQVVVGGGDTGGFVNNYSHEFTHISSGGGASVEYIGNNGLVGIF
jgi:glyceraldehyde 3-phosphate dehydrogenase